MQGDPLEPVELYGRRMIEGAHEQAVFLLDPDGCVQTWNIGATRCLGYQAEEIIGQHCGCFYPLAEVEAGRPGRALALALREGRHDEEGWQLRKDGVWLWARVSITAMYDDGGSLVGYCQATRDMTRRRLAQEGFRLAFEAAPSGMILVDGDGVIIQCNTELERIFGYGRNELLGQCVERLMPEAGGAARHTWLTLAPQRQPTGAGGERCGRRKDGSEVPIEVGIHPLATAGGILLLGSVVDASERRAVERERDALLAQLRALNEELASHVGVLEATLRERDGLLREVQHRVKNNLQLVSSLMNMQVRRSLEPPIRQVLEECQRRVQAIALIHEILHQSGDYTRVPFADYARGLANNLFQGAGGGRGAVRLELAIDSVVLAVDQAIPCGLILNELIANALEHGFPGGRGGTIRVVIARRDVQQVGVAVMDDGVGVPPEVSIEEARTLGFQLVRTLARQLKAEVTLDRAQGTCVRLQFGTEGRT